MVVVRKRKKVSDIEELATLSGRAASKLAMAGTDLKNKALEAMAKGLRENAAKILDENAQDLKKASVRAEAFIDRLTLTDERIESMARGLEEVASLPDPVGEITGMWRRPNGLLVGRMRIPLGVILLIYESRPNVTADAAGLCMKSGNSVILRGGSESIRSNLAIGKVLKAGLKTAGLPEQAIQVVPKTDRKAIDALLEMEDLIDLVIPRGGEALIRRVVEKSRIPVLKHYKGVCHVYVDESADLKMAEQICFNAKVQRPGVCNAMETLLVHEKIAPRFLPRMAKKLKKAEVELRGCTKSRKILNGIGTAKEEDWRAEYLDLVLAIRVVAGMDEAVEHIREYGSDHTESIVTRDHSNAMRFLREVGSSTVIVNASTRFSDGEQLGLGAEIGISTSRLHAFGPMGLESLTSQKFVIFGDGQIRE